MATEPPCPDDDEPVRMTVPERAAWASLATVLVSSGAYLAVMVSRVLHRPVSEISWAGPMLWTIGSAVAGTVVVTVVLTIAATARSGGCPPAGRPEVTADVRDAEIGRLGGRASTGVLGAGFGGALVLAMLAVHPFWIGNLLFLFGSAAALVEATTKIRLYRRGF